MLFGSGKELLNFLVDAAIYLFVGSKNIDHILVIDEGLKNKGR